MRSRRQPTKHVPDVRGAQPRDLDSYPQVLLVDEVAALLRIGKASVYRAVRAGALEAVRLNRRVLIPRRAVEELLAQRHPKKG